MTLPLPTLVQNPTSNTTVNGAGSVNGTYASTTQGNLLIGILAIVSSGAANTSSPFPANWVQVFFGNVASSIGLAIYYYPNNPGGITTVSVSLSNNQGAVLALQEWSGMQTAGIPTDRGIVAGTPSLNASATAIGSGFATPTYSNELVIGCQAFDATKSVSPQSNVPAAGNGSWISRNNGTSTTGTNNITLNTWSCILGFGKIQGDAMGIFGTLSGASFCGAGLAGFLSNNSVSQSGIHNAGVQGFMPNGLQGAAIGG